MAGSLSDIARFNRGAGTGVISTAGNWTAESGTPSTPPAAGEYGYFDGRVNGDVTSGSLTGLGQVDFREWGGNFGVAGTPVTLSATTVKVNAYGTMYWTCTATTFDLDNMHGGKLFHTGGTITTMRAGAANLDVGASAVITNFEGDGTVATAATGTAFTTMKLRNGRLSTERSIATGEVTGNGVLIITGSATAITTSLTIAPGAKVIYRGGGTIAALNNYGEFSVEGCPYQFTISALNGPRSAKFMRYNSAGCGATTITADNRFGGEGGSTGTGV